MQKNGFTFIELLLVLSILSMLTFIVMHISFASLHKQYENYFFQTLTEDIRYIQNIALSDRKAHASILFNSSSYEIVIRQDARPSYVRKLPEGWEIKTNLRSIAFTESGNISQAGTISINSPHNQFKVVFPLGKGSYYVTEK